MFSDPQFWVAAAFIVFVAVIFNPVRKILTSSLDKQINEIKNSLEDAENLKNEAQISLSEVKKRQNEVQSEIELINNNASKKIIQIQENLEAKLKEQIEKKQSLATLKIEQMVRDANNEIYEYISSKAIQIIKYLILNKLNDEEKQNLIYSSIKELETSMKN
tara:strand:- start:121 stop:606 length:486 start_codon:yes stop_codon:yes gene_type:complete